MSRFSRYDTDEERLPDGMTRVGYDADTQVYTFQDADGSLWESAPGNEYGQLTRVSEAPEPEDMEPFLMYEERQDRTSWRYEMGPMLNFGVIVGLSLLLLFWYLSWAGSPSKDHEVPALSCPERSSEYRIKGDDTCWDIAEALDVTVDDVLELNPKLDCGALMPGSRICLPDAADAT